jgi:hypothetical protein
MASISITWHILDDAACPICKELNGYTWTFEAGKDVMMDGLFHPKYGFVWSLSEGSNAHGYHNKGNNCRCHLSHGINAEDILAKCVYIQEMVKPALEVASE